MEIVRTCLSYQEQDRPTAEQCCDSISRLKLSQDTKHGNEEKVIEELKIKTDAEISSLKREIELLRQEKKIVKKERTGTKGAEMQPPWAISRDEIQILDQELGREGDSV